MYLLLFLLFIISICSILWYYLHHSRYHTFNDDKGMTQIKDIEQYPLLTIKNKDQYANDGDGMFICYTL